MRSKEFLDDYLCLTRWFSLCRYVMRASVVFLGLLAAAMGVELDEQYFTMPRLHHLDDYEQCLASRGNVYCVGTFDLLPHTNHRLYDYIQKYSSSNYNFNHSYVHRGHCLQTSCAHIKARSMRARFSNCVNNLTHAQYGLQTNMTQHYCRNKNTFRPIDSLEYGFLIVVGIILVANVVGTVYDLTRSAKDKPNQLLMAWSFRRSWNRLTAEYKDGDPRLLALKPTHGVKGCFMLLNIIGHCLVVHHMIYLFNPQYLEVASHTIYTLMYTNGSSLILGYLMFSNFLMAYNMLIYNEKSNANVSLKKLPKYIGNRLIRLVPVNLFIIGLTTTWWPRMGNGPQMIPILGTKSATCRRKWWTHALFINNLVRPSEPCLLHAWYLAVDTQSYVVMLILTLVLAKHPRAAVRLLAAMIIAAVAMNFYIAYHWNLKPAIAVINSESMRTHFENEPSFHYQYGAPWSGLPAALMGLLLAFVHYLQQVDGYQPGQSLAIRRLHRLSIPIALLWITAGSWMRDVTDPFWLAAYVAVDRPFVVCCVAFAIYGFLYNIDSSFWRWLSWGGWVIPSRMSLSMYLVHWLLSLHVLAVRVSVSRISFYDVGAHGLGNLFLSYNAALVIHLLLEQPATMFLRQLID